MFSPEACFTFITSGRLLSIMIRPQIVYLYTYNGTLNKFRQFDYDVNSVLAFCYYIRNYQKFSDLKYSLITM